MVPRRDQGKGVLAVAGLEQTMRLIQSMCARLSVHRAVYAVARRASGRLQIRVIRSRETEVNGLEVR
jgi:hypothetical protein